MECVAESGLIPNLTLKSMYLIIKLYSILYLQSLAPYFELRGLKTH